MLLSLPFTQTKICFLYFNGKNHSVGVMVLVQCSSQKKCTTNNVMWNCTLQGIDSTRLQTITYIYIIYNSDIINFQLRNMFRLTETVINRAQQSNMR